MLDLNGSRQGPVVVSCVHVEMCQISYQCEDLLALQELLWSMN